jgi:hemolysin activation/secretion protein
MLRVLVVGILGLSLAAEAFAAGPLDDDSTVYPVSAIVLGFPHEASEPIPLSALRQVQVRLGEDPDRLTIPSVNRPTRTLRIEEIGRDGVVALDRGAVIEICTALVRELQTRQQVGRCLPDPADILHGADVRGDRKELRLQLVIGFVEQIRTYGTGERIRSGLDATNNPVHRALREKAPEKVADLEDYVARLSRHPGRTVGLLYSRASSRDGAMTVDLLVTESKPWAAYFQTTNAGTDNTGAYRNRVGFTTTQLTGHDDILQLEYLTSDFNEIQAASGSYEAPVPGLSTARFKLFGSMSSFDNEDLGFFRNASFRGTRSELGLRFLSNIYQRHTFFLDLSLGLRAEALKVDNGIRRLTARDHLVLPSAGLRFERRSAFSSLSGGLDFEWNLAKLAGTDARARDRFNRPNEAGGLGRDNPDERVETLRFDFFGSTFLEPLFRSVDSRTSLAHEVTLRAGGQYAFANRLVPQEQAIAGGRDTVRGYEQAAAVGDSLTLGSLEYRYHFPRTLAPRPAAKMPAWLRWGGETFRYAPEQKAGPTDWDLVFKLFVDAARVRQNDPSRFEEGAETLIGSGFGIELRVRQNFTISLDLGFPLHEGKAFDVERGDPILHFALTALY